MTRAPHDDKTLLDAVLGPMAQRLRDVSLPLHILLEGRFGELNDNQLEMIHAAQDAARDGDRALRLISRVRTLRSGAAPTQPSATAPADIVRVSDLLRAPLLVAAAHVEAAGGGISTDLPPDLPHVVGDRAVLEEALTFVLSALAAAAVPGRAHVTGESRQREVVVRVTPGIAAAPASLEWALALLLLDRSGAAVEVTPREVRLNLPRAMLLESATPADSAR
jgi:hypothetical protein